jgi:3',5'-cyclic AMP phosphodiesterase CpdA
MVSINFDNHHNDGPQPPTTDRPSSVSAMTLAHLSDPHISCMTVITARDLLGKRLFGYLRWKLHRGSGHGDVVLSALHADLAKTKPDHIVVTGDLTHLSLSAEFKKARQWLQSLGSPSQVTVIPGNHDTYVNTEWHKTMAYWSEYMISDRPRVDDHNAENMDRIFPSLRIRGRLALIGVCTAQPSAPHLAVGGIGALQLDRLEKILTQTARQKYFRVLLIHHPPASGTVSWRKRLTDAPDLQALLANFGTELILHGHAHRAHQIYLKTPAGKVPVVGVPSITALDRRLERRARYHIYHISPGDDDWIVRLQARIYSPDENCFINLSLENCMWKTKLDDLP